MLSHEGAVCVFLKRRCLLKQVGAHWSIRCDRESLAEYGIEIDDWLLFGRTGGVVECAEPAKSQRAAEDEGDGDDDPKKRFV